MGQKVHPYGFRLGFNKPWRSRWFAKQGYAKLLQEDLELKETLHDRLKSAGVSAIASARATSSARSYAVGMCCWLLWQYRLPSSIQTCPGASAN